MSDATATIPEGHATISMEVQGARGVVLVCECEDHWIVAPKRGESLDALLARAEETKLWHWGSVKKPKTKVD